MCTYFVNTFSGGRNAQAISICYISIDWKLNTDGALSLYKKRKCLQPFSKKL